MKIKEDEFIKLIVELEPVEVIGLAKIMGVKLFNEENIPYTAEKIISQMIIKYSSFNRKKKRNIIKLIQGNIKG